MFSTCLKQGWHLAKTNPTKLCPLDMTDLYNRYHNSIVNVITYKTKDREMSEEIANDTFIKVMKYQDHFDGSKSSIKTWIYRIAQTIMLDYLRKAKKRNICFSVSDMVDEDGKESYQFVDKNNINEIECTELKDQITSALDRLKPQYKRIAVLFFVDRATYKEIAKVCDMPMSSVKVGINRCRKILQKELVNVKKEYAIM